MLYSFLILSYLGCCHVQNTPERTRRLRVSGSAGQAPVHPSFALNVHVLHNDTLHVRPSQALYIRSHQWHGQTAFSTAHWSSDRRYMVNLADYLSWFGADHNTLKRRHTSVVVFNKEIFYGQGICITQPGKSQVRRCRSRRRLSCYTMLTPTLISMDHQFGSSTWERPL